MSVNKLTQRRPEAKPQAIVPLHTAYERIRQSILDHSLPPGTRLVEDQLCDVFGIGRTRIRQVLQRLAHEHVVTLMPNRGAVVTKPSVQQAREVFEARAVLEGAIMTKLLGVATQADRRRLREHLQREKLAWQAMDRRAIIKLSGEFHLILAEAAGNSVLLDTMRGLVSRSSLIIAAYQAPGALPCPAGDHEALCFALETSDRTAIRLMQQHLKRVLSHLDLVLSDERSVDLRSVLSHVA
ncbi:MAG TPA: GntR family transcriptional regulator [Steroidobacteraceae bacterium]